MEITLIKEELLLNIRINIKSLQNKVKKLSNVTGSFQNSVKEASNYPAVGDWVALSGCLDDNIQSIEGVFTSI